MLAKVAVPIIPAEEEKDQERTPLDLCVCPEGHMAPAGLGARRKGCSRASGEANCETQEGPWQPPGSNSTPSATNWAAVSAFSLSPLLSFQSFHLFTYFGLTQPQWISLPCDQTIHHEDKWAKSQSSEKQSSYQKGSILQGLQVAVKFCILCSLPKCFLFNTSVFQ